MQGLINVSVPPKLNAFSVDKHLKLGQRVSMLCSATEGDLPMSLRWFRDGVPVESRPQASDLRISITELGAYESVLRIDDLRPEHNANFSCRAENQAGHATHSQKLLVKGKFNYELMKAAMCRKHLIAHSSIKHLHLKSTKMHIFFAPPHSRVLLHTLCAIVCTTPPLYKYLGRILSK